MPERHFRVRISGPDKVLREFLSRYPNDPLDVQREGDQVTIELLIGEGLLPEAEELGGLKRLFDATEVGRARQSQVGKGNRYKNGAIPVGLGLKQ